MAASCLACGRSLRPNEIYCRQCGARHQVSPPAAEPVQGRHELFVAPPPVPVQQPAPVSPRLRGGWNPVATVAVVLAVVGLGLVGLLGFVTPGFFVAASTRTTSPPAPVGVEPVVPMTTYTTAPATPEYATPATPTTSDTVAGDEPTAQSLLQREVDADRSRAESFVGSWLPQLSAKKPGMTVDGVVYDYRKTWSDFLDKRAQHPDAMLVWSGDFAGFRYPDYWITVMPEPFSTGQSANGWCADQGIGKDDCYAKRLTHTGGYEGNTLLRK